MGKPESRCLAVSPSDEGEWRRMPHESTVVMGDDDVRLHVEIDGFPDAPITVVLCHGYALNCGSWRFQRVALADLARVVSWDHRGHGRSDRGRLSARTTIDQMGEDLLAVLDATTPHGPVVLVGHSMGGMAIMALAEAHPALFGNRITGAALLATSAGPVNTSFGLPPQTATAVNWTALRVLSVIDRLRGIPGCSRAVRELTLRIACRCSFASDVPAPTVAFLADMIHSTPPEVIADLLPQFVSLDKFAALPVLGNVETLVLAAADDVITSPEDSRAIAEAVPGAHLVLVPRAGHAVILEHPDRVSTCLRSLLASVGVSDASAGTGPRLGTSRQWYRPAAKATAARPRCPEATTFSRRTACVTDGSGSWRQNSP
jgi:pimeloyl-ACP methyl ester carboxylesterase